MEKRTDMRAEALDTLIDIERNKKLSHIAIGETLMRHQFEKKSDRAFYTRLCEGVTERKIYLDYILDTYSKTPMRKCKPLIRSLLRMGAYQILFMDVRDAAACSEAVSLAKKRGFARLSGFVNGVLRTIVREKDRLPVPDKKEFDKYLSITYSVPEWLSRLMIDQYGAQTAEMMFASFRGKTTDDPYQSFCDHTRGIRRGTEKRRGQCGKRNLPSLCPYDFSFELSWEACSFPSRKVCSTR